MVVKNRILFLMFQSYDLILIEKAAGTSCAGKTSVRRKGVGKNGKSGKV